MAVEDDVEEMRGYATRLELELAKAQAESARLKQYNDELCGDLLDQRGKLRDLLGPTVELLESYKKSMENTPLGGGPFGLPDYLFVEHSHVLSQLARLRAAREGK